MRITELWKSKPKPTVSFELFPARTEKAAQNLGKVLDKLAAAEPDFVSVTFGAGGSTREGSRELIERLQQQHGQRVMAYFAGYGLGPEAISDVLDAYQSLGVESLLVVRGDPPRDAEGFAPHPQGMSHASDLLRHISERWSFCLGAAGHPEGHAEAESRDRDLDYLKLKVDRGADYIISNFFYDNRFFLGFRDRCLAAGIDVPILPGVMPVYTPKLLEMLTSTCGATVTDAVRSGLAALPEGDKEAVLQFGIDLATEQCRGLLREGVPGVHLYTMDRSKSAAEIVRRLRGEGLI